MNLLRYLLVSSLCLVLAYGVFRIIFRNGLGFRQQRLFLIASLVLSMLLPLISFRFDYPKPTPKSYEVVTYSEFAGLSATLPKAELPVLMYTDVLLYVYVIISASFILLVVVQIFKILSLGRKSFREKNNNIVVMRSERINSSFSFFKWIFIPPDLIDPEEMKCIIAHESIHAAQYHTIDNLMIEIATALMWFHPVLWMMKKSLHLVHEYLADEGALNAGIDKLSYQTLLLNRAAEDKLIYVPSGFNNNLLKKRLIMMTKSKNPGTGKFRFLNLLSLSAILFIAVAMLNGLFPQEIKAQKIKSTQEVKKTDIKEAKKVQTKKQKVEDVPLNSTGKKEEDLNPATVSGYAKEPVSKGKKNDLKEVTVIGYGTQDSDPEETQKEITVVGYKISSPEPINITESKIISNKPPQVTIASKSDSLPVNYIVDGVHVNSLEELNPDSIGSINVMKSDNTMFIRTKSFERKIAVKKPEIELRGINGSAVYILNGKVVPQSVITNLPADQIESISVIKDKKKIKMYTDEDSDGMIIITTKQ